ncbi:J domain-containing protein [Poseidonibacter lekithochrous]|uniref:J domain-containing protein n=1 Tax=Poseidonibacter TaxID=2321187 RepID=UPI001C08F11E|nr:MULTISPECIES: J domain-containing protein [Poseidonibacter]MBU3014100.1 J domain-containing protein [Poseidonibacter lekithochrous]MDO6827398.1 J domain-containing protein [Poseidonibacter sp. 1_MG-2023]
MIKKILKIFLAVILLLIKKIFVRKNRVAHKIMDALANKFHSIFIVTSFSFLYISLLNIHIKEYSLNPLLYVLLFLQFVVIIRYFNPEMLKIKPLQSRIITLIKKVSLVLFIVNWVFVSFLFSLSFIAIFFINYGLYVFIINQINKQKEQEEFKKQFGEGNYSSKDIVKKHVENLFEANIDEKQLTRNEIKKQYRLMAKKYHPDVYDGTDNDKFASINLSYNFLLDLVKSSN